MGLGAGGRGRQGNSWSPSPFALPCGITAQCPIAAVLTLTLSAPVFGYPNPITPGQSLRTGMGRNAISIIFKDSPIPIFF